MGSAIMRVRPTGLGARPVRLPLRHALAIALYGTRHSTARSRQTQLPGAAAEIQNRTDFMCGTGTSCAPQALNM
jgi:hypothetical protein